MKLTQFQYWCVNVIISLLVIIAFVAIATPSNGGQKIKGHVETCEQIQMVYRTYENNRTEQTVNCVSHEHARYKDGDFVGKPDKVPVP